MGFWDSIVDALKIDSDEDDDDLLYDNEMSELEKKEKKSKKISFKRKPQREEYYEEPSYDTRRDRDYESRNSVPPRSPEGNFNPRDFVTRRREIEVFKAYHFGDAQEVCDKFLNGHAIIVNIENAHAEDAQRIMDFVFGCVYAVNGFFHPMSETSFLISETEIEVPSYNNANDSVVPIFNKMI